MNLDAIYERLNALESLYKNWVSQYCQHKKPYKCPVCEGATHFTKPNYQDGGDFTYKCLSCEGKGIVWSP